MINLPILKVFPSLSVQSICSVTRSFSHPDTTLTGPLYIPPHYPSKRWTEYQRSSRDEASDTQKAARCVFVYLVVTKRRITGRRLRRWAAAVWILMMIQETWMGLLIASDTPLASLLLSSWLPRLPTTAPASIHSLKAAAPLEELNLQTRLSSMWDSTKPLSAASRSSFTPKPSSTKPTQPLPAAPYAWRIIKSVIWLGCCLIVVIFSIGSVWIHGYGCTLHVRCAGTHPPRLLCRLLSLRWLPWQDGEIEEFNHLYFVLDYDLKSMHVLIYMKSILTRLSKNYYKWWGDEMVVEV